MNAIVIRLATFDDLPALRALIPESVRGLSRPFYSDTQIKQAIVQVFGVDTQLINDGTYFVAEIGGVIAGCGGWSRRRTLYGGDQMKAAEDPLLDPSGDAARIRAFFVHPTYARRGIGGAILRASEAAAREAGFLALELVATLPGEPLYRAFGFEAVERYEAVLPGGVMLPLVAMRKEVGVR
ncbi:MAG: GNAT family N-acetyltransferase [Rhodothermales bacterium]|nr:GNAT family N-acetyltransferase [Rhodothermales bacterium]